MEGSMNLSSMEEDEFLMPSMIDMSKYTSVQDVLPPPNNEDLHVLIMAVSYLLLFLLGTCGNVAVLTTIYHVVRSSRATLDNTLIYVIVLSCVDFGVCLSLPFTVIDQILGFWMFGTVPCKLHAVFENFGKILSALILTAMSFDRYAGVCHPQKKFLRSRKLAITILIGLAAYALITLCPLLWSFTSREIIMFARETGYRKITRMKIEKCTVDIDSQMFTAFTIYQFVLCYCTPLVLIAYFYSKLLRKLREHARTFKSSHIPLMRISLYTLAVACFYFLCWTPFWMATVFAVYLENTGDSEGTVPPLFVYIMYFIHALPFTNSAINWILYGALNGQLQQRYGRTRSMKSTAKSRPTTASAVKMAQTMNGSATIPNPPTEGLPSSGDGDSEMVDVRLLAAHEPTNL
uniref:G_PROTEIN_RECEP_F1_2 domain-containing protein n=2 Tax=Haemonchus contortus TaxID=6289 RepID=A0A7I5E9A9_HAECO